MKMMKSNKTKNKSIQFPFYFKIFVIFCFTISIIVIILLSYHSINGYNDLKGITTTENDFKPWKLMYIIGMCCSLFYVLFVQLIIWFFILIRKDRTIINKFLYISLLFDFVPIIVILINTCFGYKGFFHSFNENWNTETIQFIEHRFHCSIEKCEILFYETFNMRRDVITLSQMLFIMCSFVFSNSLSVLHETINNELKEKQHYFLIQ